MPDSVYRWVVTPWLEADPLPLAEIPMYSPFGTDPAPADIVMPSSPTNEPPCSGVNTEYCVPAESERIDGIGPDGLRGVTVGIATEPVPVPVPTLVIPAGAERLTVMVNVAVGLDLAVTVYVPGSSGAV